MSTTLQAIQEILIANFPLKIEAVGADAELDQLDIDSLSIVEVLFEVEEKLGITVPSDSGAMRNTLKTVGDLASYVDTLIAGQRAAAPPSADDTAADDTAAVGTKTPTAT